MLIFVDEDSAEYAGIADMARSIARDFKGRALFVHINSDEEVRAACAVLHCACRTACAVPRRTSPAPTRSAC